MLQWWQRVKPIRDALLVFLAMLVPFFFLKAHVRDPKDWSNLDRAVVQLSWPAQAAAAWAARGISNLWGDYIYLVDVKSDNARLA
ncbi:MAG: hypothetical protein RMJ98_21965, partial [Myxococcales bacterium]|nr:rod shape-determining protein MreC [Polyangiaceae bacterium]MDW8251972.1 hypothetical protein [Myxococcales bacterium]